MGDINAYTENALIRSGKTIRNYHRRTEHGVVIINYDLVDRANGAAAGLCISAATGWSAQFGLALVSAVVPVAAPVLIAGVVGGMIVAPVAGTAVGAMVGACHSRCHYFDIETGNLIGSNKNEASESLDRIGRRLFQEGAYVEAERYHENAYQFCSPGYENEQIFLNNRNRARTEIRASNLNDEGEELFAQGDYTEACRKYQEALNESQIENCRQIYYDNRNRAQAEINAININAEGDNLFNQGNYIDAQRRYQEAINVSRVDSQRNTYVINRNRAQAEINAININAEGDNLFNQGNYINAQRRYQEAIDVSRVDSQRNTYVINRNRAQAEINAININAEGDNLLNQGNYTEAEKKYQNAYNMSNVENQRNTYKNQIITSKLLELDILWNKAWDAENDLSNDRSNEAEEIFQSILSKSKSALELFPDNFKFKQIETLVSLKIEGNDLFNQGIDLQQSGVKLLKEAQVLKDQQKNDLADAKLREAKHLFGNAKEKFLEGSKIDQRFASCVEFVVYHIEQVILSIEKIEEIKHNSQACDLSNNVNNGNCIFSTSFGFIAATENSNYYAQI